LVERIAQEMGLRASLLRSVDERQQSWLAECVAAFLSAPAKNEWTNHVSESSDVRHLVETVLALGAHGECVIVGRGAPFILPAETTLRVRLIGPLKERELALADQLGISTAEAARRLHTLDRERSDFVRDHFCKDPADPHHFDLVLDFARFSVAGGAGVIVDALRRLAQPPVGAAAT